VNDKKVETRPDGNDVLIEFPPASLFEALRCHFACDLSAMPSSRDAHEKHQNGKNQPVGWRSGKIGVAFPIEKIVIRTWMLKFIVLFSPGLSIRPGSNC
jgi:hypothetical protein